jgi:hypothetical protein
MLAGCLVILAGTALVTLPPAAGARLLARAAPSTRKEPP